MEYQKEPLRHVAFYVPGGRYTLRTWDLHRRREGSNHWLIGYEFRGPTGKVIFEGEDYGCSPMDAIDSDACLRGLLGFLTLKPGDADEDYFRGYSPEQMAFAEGDAEDIALYTLEDSDEYDSPAWPFEEIAEEGKE